MLKFNMRLNRKIRLNNSWLVFLLLFSLFPPRYFEENAIINLVLAAMKFFAALIVLLVYIKKIKLHLRKKYNILLVCIWLELLVSTFISVNIGASVYQCCIAMLQVITTCFLVEELMTYAPIYGIKCMYIYFSLCVLVNTATVFIFPNAMYADQGGWRCWILGDDNTGYAYYIVASTIASLYVDYIAKRITFISICVWVSAFIYVFQRGIGTGIMCQLIWLFLFLGSRFKCFRKILNAHYALYITIGFFLLIVLSRKFILEPIVTALGKTVTLSGRTIIWDTVLKSVRDKICLGYGFFVREGFNKLLSLRGGGTHNYFLNLLFQGGIVGVSLFSMLIFYACRTKKELLGTNYYKCLTIGLLVLAVRFLVENGRNEFFYMVLAMISYTPEFIENYSKLYLGQSVKPLCFKIRQRKLRIIA